MSCSEAISSSSGGVTDVLSDCGRAISVVDYRRSAGDRLPGQSFPIDESSERDQSISEYLPVTFKIG